MAKWIKGSNITINITAEWLDDIGPRMSALLGGEDMTRAEIVAALDAEVHKLDETMQLAWMRIRHLALSGERQDGICILFNQGIPGQSADANGYGRQDAFVRGNCRWHHKVEWFDGPPLDVARDIAWFYSLHLGKNPGEWFRW